MSVVYRYSADRCLDLRHNRPVVRFGDARPRFGYLRHAHVRIDILRVRLPLRMTPVSSCPAACWSWFVLHDVVHGGELALNTFDTMERACAPLGLLTRWITKSALPLGGVVLLAGLSVAILNTPVRRVPPIGTAATIASETLASSIR
ncbi:hypothetical protein SAMN02745126_04805 [Enhydrobacter aerosaccus]|uniref:Uncharacterized protein n=1 Tax=Enhydrobacter aerosaccus TaxID=225324 RepID=A0A1T4SK68_9HYPH|nr:hypothetical protein [Enhydrobacter aerosaccus]SKA28592.1 hypothetical protein SAMN02745126_04805 [Enhydrobacter aerosaccus]